MVTRDFSGRDIVKVLRKHGFVIVNRSGSHVRLRYDAPELDAPRLVTVPLHRRVRTGTLVQIADQCGANDFHEWCRWIDEHR